MAEHRKNRLLRFHITAPGTLAPPETFARLPLTCVLDPAQCYELGPDGLCADGMGGYWVAHYGGGRVLHVDADGSVDRAILLAQGKRPTNVCPGPAGCLFVTESDTGRVYRLSP